MSLSKIYMLCLVLVQPRKTHPDMTKKSVGCKESKQTNTGDFLTFLMLGQGPVEFGEKHFEHQNWNNLMQSERTGPPVKLLHICCFNCRL